MKEQIRYINQSIDEKRNRLKEKVERYFATIPSISVPQMNQQKKGGKKQVPPISYLLYGVAGLSAIGVIASDSKFMCMGLAAISALGGYKLSQIGNADTTLQTVAVDTTGSLKNEVVSKVLDSVKKTTKEWEDFMELKQKEIQSVLATSSENEEIKDAMYSKIFIYEIIDISISEFSNLINTSNSISDIKQNLSLYKVKLLSAIDNAANKQIAKYNSLVL